MRHIFNYLWFFVTTVITGGAALLLRPFDSGYLPGGIWGRWMCFGLGVNLQVKGLQNFEHLKPYVVMMNHRSYVDVISLFAAYPGHISFVAKKGLMWIPVFGIGMWGAQTILIDRKNSRLAKASLDKAGEIIRSGRSVMIFPEGTRSTDGKLSPFKNGGFHLAKAARSPILPVAIGNTSHLMPKGSFLLKSGTVNIMYGEPIMVGGEESIEELMEKTLKAIQELKRAVDKMEAV